MIFATCPSPSPCRSLLLILSLYLPPTSPTSRFPLSFLSGSLSLSSFIRTRERERESIRDCMTMIKGGKLYADMHAAKPYLLVSLLCFVLLHLPRVLGLPHLGFLQCLNIYNNNLKATINCHFKCAKE